MSSGRPRIRGSIADRGKTSILSHSNPAGRPWDAPTFLLTKHCRLFPGDKVVFQLHSVPRLRMQGSKPPLTHMPSRPAQEQHNRNFY